MHIYAHRGSSQTHPENTLAAFAEALRLKVYGIELDVHATRDGVLVVCHDESLMRTFGVDLQVGEATFAEIQRAAPDLPTLASVLAIGGDRVHFDIEVKQVGIEQPLLQLLANSPVTRWAISSFNWDVLRAIRAENKSSELWLLSPTMSADLVKSARELQATTAALYAPMITQEVVHLAKSAGLATMAWTVNDPDRAAELRSYGVDSLCTDAPHLFVD